MVPTFDKLKGFLRNFYLKHPEMTRSAIISVVFLMPVGFGLLKFGVDVCGYSKVATNAIVGVVMNPIGFWMQRSYGFRSRDTLKRESAPLWAAKTGITSGASMTSFSVLVGVYGLPYEIVRWALNFTLGPISYLINKLFIFKGRRPLSRLIKKVWILIRGFKKSGRCEL